VPDLDPYEDWAMWRTEVADENSAYFFAQSNNRDFDIKAQRRLPELQMTYNLVIKRQTVTAATLGITVIASILLKLP